MKSHVIAIEHVRDADHAETAQHFVGTANSTAEAVELCRAAGWMPFVEGEGGSVDQYDAEDAPNVYSFEADGMGAISVTVYAA